MASTKRKRASTRSQRNKRPKYVDSSESEDNYWEAEAILDERIHQRKRQYLIKWKGIDPASGKEWIPTWEPESNPNQQLLDSWEEEKARKGTSSTESNEQSDQDKHCLEKQQQRQAKAQPPPRKLQVRLVESSPEPPPANSSAVVSESSTIAHEDSVSLVHSSTTTSPTCAPAVSTRISPRIQIGARGSSFEPQDFERYSQLAATQSVATQPHTQETDLDSSQVFTDTRPFSSGIVPDSQSSIGEASFLPATQLTGQSSHQSTSSNEEQTQEVTEDSGLLEIINQAASRASSPAISVAETDPDIISNSQDQHQSLDVQPSVEIPDTFEIVESSSQSVQAVDEGKGSALDHGNAPQDILQAESQGQDGHITQEESISSEPRDSVLRFVHESPLQAILYSETQQDQSESNTGKDPIFFNSAKDQSGYLLEEQRAQATVNDSPTDISCGQPQPIPEVTPSRQEIVNGISKEPQARSFQQISGCAAEASLSEQSSSEKDPLSPFHYIFKSTAHTTESRGENAQIVPAETVYTPQDDSIESIRPTVEKDDLPCRLGSESRHDSSQESPTESLRPDLKSSSSVPSPPLLSLGFIESALPPRPNTPTSTSSTMANYDTGDEVARQLKERLAKRQAENPFTPTRRFIRSSLTTSTAPDSATEDATPAPTSARTLLGMNASPSVANTEGTRSPSMVPDHSPAPQGPTSLRTVAFAPPTPDPIPVNVEMTLNSSEQPEPTDKEAVVNIEEQTIPSDVPMTEPEDEDLSDADDDENSVASLLNDDLNLDHEEYIVPLFTEVRQKDMYTAHLKQKKDVLGQFLRNPDEFSPFSEVEDILSYLRAIETHIDLVYAEAEPSSEAETASQSQYVAQFGTDNSIKFRFLQSLLNSLRESQKHIVLLTEKDNDALFNILETFCKAQCINYNMPTKGRQADLMDFEGSLAVTIFPSDASPLVRPPDLIICIDGVHEARDIRRMDWARSSELESTPILHLVIPRTVGHIERYLSPTLDDRERAHTICASLGQMQTELGKPFDEDTPRATLAAGMVKEWLTERNTGADWPLPSIGSIKHVIEYQTQVSHPPTEIAAPERIKRPLENGESDSAKRMRFTPQAMVNSSSNNEHEVTHISDSLPGTEDEHTGLLVPTTVDDVTSLLAQLASAEDAYKRERDVREAEEQSFHEQKEMWDKQQTNFENLNRDYRILLGEKKHLEEKLETLIKNHETLRERLTNTTTEKRELAEQLEAQRAIHLLTDDEKIAEITQLRKQLADEQKEKQSAANKAQISESTLEYTKEQYRVAQDAASSSQKKVDDLTTVNARLQRQASEQPVKLKAIHFDRQYDIQMNQLKILKAENQVLKKSLGLKEEELQRAKNNMGRVGVGTRAQSVTPQPKVRSRAASPMGGRLSNLRNG